MTSVLWSNMHLAVAVSWFGVASHQLDEHLLQSSMVIWMPHATMKKISRLTSSHLCKDSNVTSRFSKTTIDRVVIDFLAQQNINALPAVSPDLAPIEHVWDEMQRVYVCVLISWWCCSGESDIRPDLERRSPGILQQFGKLYEVTVPGLHKRKWWPYALLTLWTGFWPLVSFISNTNEMLDAVTF